MSNEYLESLSNTVRIILNDGENIRTIERLKRDIKTSEESFVWATVELEKIPRGLPEIIKSIWIFVLKIDTPSGSHYHPNSIQHMTMIEGKGRSHIGEIWKEMALFFECDKPEDQWEVIAAGVPHEFFPREMNMVVISFHTCAPDELIEISTDSKHQRRYEGTPP